MTPIANQLLSEFMLISDIGDINLRDLFMIVIQYILTKDFIKTKIVGD